MDQVRAAALKYLPANQLSTVVVGPLEAIRKAPHPRWPASLDEVLGNAAAGGPSK